MQPTPAFGHLFPFADTPQTDPASGRNAGLLDRLRARNAMPKVVYTDTSSEYWRGDAGLTHLDLTEGTDVEPKVLGAPVSEVAAKKSPDLTAIHSRAVVLQVA